jgi:hypothetical protein
VLKLIIIDTGLPDAPSFNGRIGDTVQFYDVQTTTPRAVVATVQSVRCILVLYHHDNAPSTPFHFY